MGGLSPRVARGGQVQEQSHWGAGRRVNQVHHPIETPDRNHTHSSKDRERVRCQELKVAAALPATTAKAQDCKARPPNSKLTRRPRTRHPAQRTQVRGQEQNTADTRVSRNSFLCLSRLH